MAKKKEFRAAIIETKPAPSGNNYGERSISGSNSQAALAAAAAALAKPKPVKPARDSSAQGAGKKSL